MKRKCEYCGTALKGTADRCPNCGAPIKNNPQSDAEHPATIEDLKKWYSDRGLPPYETTRFFIGINYRKPKAFGIYKDENTGNFVVYKNKAGGERSVRYEGPDEAHAVNELLQRLKQEILNQKSRNQNSGSSETGKKKGGLGGCLLWLLLAVVGFVIAPIMLIMGIGTVITLVEPKTGYYLYEGGYYYRSEFSYDNRYWFRYDNRSREWSYPISEEETPETLQSRRAGKSSFLAEDWDSSMHCSDFSRSIYQADLNYGMYLDTGYYSCDGTIYYHLVRRHEESWYVYSGRWLAAPYEDLPDSLRHTSLASGYYLAEEFDARTVPAKDFKDSLYYRDYLCSENVDRGYYYYDGSIFYHLADLYDEGWYTYSDDEWRTADTLPEELTHPSLIGDYYYSPNWDDDTRFTDFTDTELYRQDKDNWSSSSSNSSYDWSSNDSWDSGDTDWGSDW